MMESRDENIIANENKYDCTHCKRFFKKNKGLLLHLHACKKKHCDGPNEQENKTLENDPVNVITEIHETMKIHDETDPSSRNVFYWNDMGSTIFIKDLRDAYEGIVFWRKYIFVLPTGAAGKRYINHITQLLPSGHEPSQGRLGLVDIWSGRLRTNTRRLLYVVNRTYCARRPQNVY